MHEVEIYKERELEICQVLVVGKTYLIGVFKMGRV